THPFPIFVANVAGRMAHDLAHGNEVSGFVSDGLERMTQRVKIPSPLSFTLSITLRVSFVTAATSVPHDPPRAVMNTRPACSVSFAFGRLASHSRKAATVSGHSGQILSTPVLGRAYLSCRGQYPMPTRAGWRRPNYRNHS